MPKNSIEFERQYSNLNKAQKQAVDTIDGPVVVIAGPGTGKTTILTLRIANIIQKTDTAPENILALTFTESGAYAIRKKLVELIGSLGYKVNIHTFHGFAEKIISAYPDYFPRIIGSKLITDVEKIKIIEDLVQAKDIEILRPYGQQNYYVSAIISEIGNLKKENITIDRFKTEIKKENNRVKILKKESKSKTEIEKNQKRLDKNRELCLIYERYEQALLDNKFYDFDDSLFELIKLLEKDDNFKLILQEEYQYVLADEHQDANESQNRILELLTDYFDSPNLFIVGDDKQAIYRFQGASLNNFLYFKDKYKNAKVIQLENNYRSIQTILDASHSLIQNNPAPDGKRIRLLGKQNDLQPINVHEFSKYEDELIYLAEQIKKYHKDGTVYDEMAILYRNNADALEIAEILKEKSIPYKIESDKDILEEIEPAKLLLILRAIDDLSNSQNLSKALILSEFNLDIGLLGELFKKSGRSGIELYRAIKDQYNSDKTSKDLAKIYSAYQTLESWAKQDSIIALPNLIKIIIDELGIISGLIKNPDSLDRISSLEEFLKKVKALSQSKKKFSLRDFINYIDKIYEYGFKAKSNNADHIDGVRLMTVHRSKGLEFDRVFLVKCFDGNWGNKRSRQHFDLPFLRALNDNDSDTRIEDERRLFYVAMTRARKSIDISFSVISGDKEVVISQFITEIDKEFLKNSKPEVVKEIVKASKKVEKPSSQLLDKNFIKSKFLAQPLAVTHLNNYLKCPWHYFFVNLIRIPEIENKHQIYGTAVHNALKSYFDNYKKDIDIGLNTVIKIFTQKVEDSILTKQEKIDSIKKGKSALEGYFDTYKNTWNKNLFTEYNVKVDFDLDKNNKLTLTGNLDKLELIDQSNVCVVDYKTSEPMSRNKLEGKTKDGDGNYKRQLVFYKLLLDLEGKFKMNSGLIDFIEPNSSGIYKKEQFIIEDGEVEILKETIRGVSKDVINLNFIDRRCDQYDCEYCKLADLI